MDYGHFCADHCIQVRCNGHRWTFDPDPWSEFVISCIIIVNNHADKTMLFVHCTNQRCIMSFHEKLYLSAWKQ